MSKRTREIEEQIKESDKYIPSSIEAQYDNFDSPEEVIEEHEEMDKDEYEKQHKFKVFKGL